MNKGLAFLLCLVLLIITTLIILNSKKNSHPLQHVGNAYKNDIAIVIGAEKRETPLLFSRAFHHVIAVEDEDFSRDALQKKFEAAHCPNVTICQQSVPNTLTFKQLVFDYVYENAELYPHKISFIDVNGGEENVLEDILHFAYYNNAKVYVSFDLDRWKSKKIADYTYLFPFFHTSIPTDNLNEHPQSSILFEPRADAGALIKKNMTAVIIGYNQLTFIKNMVSQLEKYTSDIVVIDNDSHYQPLLDYYQNQFKYTLLKQKMNFGYRVSEREPIQKLVGDVYILTDPDLQFNPHLPNDFISTLIDISNHFDARKTGFALFIDSDDIRTDLRFFGLSIKEWEGQFWVRKVDFPKDPHLEIYKGDIDTTFCVVNKRHHSENIRVAGDFTCFHIPWHKDFQKQLAEGEYEAYLQRNNSSNFFKIE